MKATIAMTKWWPVAVALVVGGCFGAEEEPIAGGGGGGGGGGESAQSGGDGPVVSATGNAELEGSVLVAKDHLEPIVPLLRSYVSAHSAMAKGAVWLRLCADAGCHEVVGHYPTDSPPDYVLSSGFPHEIRATGLPEGQFYAQWVLDTSYSGQYRAVDGLHVDPFDVLPVGATGAASGGDSHGGGTTLIALSEGQPARLDEVVLGHVVFAPVATPPETDQGVLVALSSGAPDATGTAYRNRARVVDLATGEILQAPAPQLGGSDFRGDLCGMIRGVDGRAFAVGVGDDGAYVFTFDEASRAFTDASPAWIPHPSCTGGTCPTSLAADQYPWPCRGSVAQVAGRQLLVLIEFQGAGATPATAAYPMVVVDVTNKTEPSVVQLVKVGEYDNLKSSRIFRGIETIGSKAFLLEPSWSGAVAEESSKAGVAAASRLWTVPLSAAGLDWPSASFLPVGTADDTCEATNHWPPALKAVGTGAQARLLVGTDGGVIDVSASGVIRGTVALADHGRLITDIAVSPDGSTAYGVPACKSQIERAHVTPGGKSAAPIDLDRHAVAELDLLGDALRVAERNSDYDGDGRLEQGIELEFLHLKADLLAWCASCSGVVPPTAYTGPAIAVGPKGLYLRGTGIQTGNENQSSGLGQVGDIGFYSLVSGKGAVFRDYNVWLDGPSARWGFELAPEMGHDVSVSSITWLP